MELLGGGVELDRAVLSREVDDRRADMGFDLTPRLVLQVSVLSGGKHQITFLPSVSTDGMSVSFGLRNSGDLRRRRVPSGWSSFKTALAILARCSAQCSCNNNHTGICKKTSCEANTSASTRNRIDQRPFWQGVRY